MAIDDIIPEIWRASYETRLRQISTWRPLVRDESGEVAEAGDTVNIPLKTDDLVIADYTLGTAGTDNPARTSSDNVALSLSNQKAIFTTVELVDERESRPSIIAEAGIDAAEKMVKEHDKAIATAARATGVTALGDVSVDADGTGDSAPGAKTHREAYLDKLFEAALVADKALWPENERYLVCSPSAKFLILSAIKDAGVHYTVSPIQDSVLQRWTVEGPLGSFIWRMDPQLDSTPFSGTGGITDSNKATVNARFPNEVFFGLLGRGLHFAQSVNQLRTQDVQLRFATRLMGLSVYGAVRSRNEMVMNFRTNYT